MHFSRLRLLGFKSFVDPTELVIAPGLTGVVGPNGCGKSNLLEALRWVMGENRPSVMRGDGMEDVIFAGSGSRKARNHAEVTLAIDNSDRLAPAAFNAEDTLEIVRRITRDAGSAYRVNGKEARARDVQVLFADASTGSQSPALVRQGQISELINARPKARRRILEEAAGIAGLYARRHEAELKLKATEANLARVADVLEALEAQLGTLSRQARAAARYREVAEALRRAEALLLWRHWQDAEAERAAAAAALTAALATAGGAEAAAAAAARARLEAEAGMPGARDEDAIAGAVLQRLVRERDRLDAEAEAVAAEIAGHQAALGQIEADRGREAGLDHDAAAVMARLEAERAGLRAEGEDHPGLLDEAQAAAEGAAEMLAAAEQRLDALAGTAARLAAEHQAAERARGEARRRVEEAERAEAQAGVAATAAEGERAGAEAAVAEGEVRAAATAAAAEAADDALATAEARAAEARGVEAEVRARTAAADGAVKALASEAAGLERLLARRTDGAEAGVLDQIRVSPGLEAALGAALAEDLAQPVLEGAAAGRGWRSLAPFDPAAPLPAGVRPLAAEMTAPAALGRRLAAIGLVERDAGATLQAALLPGQRLVSREGDLWRWDGLSLPAGAAPSATALRLQQLNRLEEVLAALSAAEDEAEAGHGALAAAGSAREAATRAEADARAARKAAEAAASEAERALGRAGTALEGLEARAAGLAGAVRRRRDEAATARDALAAAEALGAGLDDPAAARAAVEAERLRVDGARIAALTRRGAAEELARAGVARDRRLEAIAREEADWQGRQRTAAGRLADLDRRAGAAAAALAAARTRPDEIAARRDGLALSLEEAEARRRRAAEMLATADSALRTRDQAARETERAAGEAREARARAEALAEAATARATVATERATAELGHGPETVPAGFGLDAGAVAGARELEGEIDRLRRQRDAMGPVNLRAEEDAREIAVERDGLARERADLEEAIGKLRQGIASLNREGRGRLLAAFDEVNRNFSVLFRHLFGGGEANLVMVESDDPLEAGLEIMCCPPGKKLSTLSLLSGGEQTLTALSLIFGVFLANPSPICVLDEVDAPLDDANVGRFCDLLDEMTERTRTRFLIITHHAVTMARMDRLFGVTMQEKGVSQLVSVDLAAAERIVA